MATAPSPTLLLPGEPGSRSSLGTQQVGGLGEGPAPNPSLPPAVQRELRPRPHDPARVLQDGRRPGGAGVAVPDGDQASGHPPLRGQELPRPLAGPGLGAGECRGPAAICSRDHLVCPLDPWFPPSCCRGPTVCRIRLGQMVMRHSVSKQLVFCTIAFDPMCLGPDGFPPKSSPICQGRLTDRAVSRSRVCDVLILLASGL